ncbi:MAG: hypothetical protein M3R06_09895, partial [Chloroflexota bacterium]|nr:hypothetical protein [Chloroflexota bacterium]
MRRLSVVLKLAMLTGLVGGLLGATAPTALAAHGGPNVEIHKAECDSASTDLFADCHDDVVADITFSILNANDGLATDGPGIPATLLTDDAGEATFAVEKGQISTTVTELATDVAAYDGIYVYCQEVVSDTDETPVGTALVDGRE